MNTDGNRSQKGTKMRSGEEILYAARPRAKARRRREEVLLGIWEGRTTKQIAGDLGVSPKTVEYHRAQLYRVFGVSDPVSLCRRAIYLGLIEPELPQRNAKNAKSLTTDEHG
jgi:DNA-binding NarL/FixJ family response regulator